MAFVKLDCGILNSTLWCDYTARSLFITSLLMAEPWELTEPEEQLEIGAIKPTGFVVPPGWYGFVKAASTGIIRTAMVSREDGMEALKTLGSPDPESRSKAFEGRRMVRVDGGFLILNYMKYRERDQTAAERAKRYREKRKTEAASHRDVTQSHVTVTEGEGEGEQKQSIKRGVPPNPQGAPPVEPPVGWPRAESEAVAIGERSGVPGEFTARKWNEAMGVGYVDWNGKPIRSFAHWIKSEFGRHQENEKRIENRNQTGGKPQRVNRNEGTHNTGDAERYRRSGNVVSA